MKGGVYMASKDMEFLIDFGYRKSDIENLGKEITNIIEGEIAKGNMSEALLNQLKDLMSIRRRIIMDCRIEENSRLCL